MTIIIVLHVHCSCTVDENTQLWSMEILCLYTVACGCSTAQSNLYRTSSVVSFPGNDSNECMTQVVVYTLVQLYEHVIPTNPAKHVSLKVPSVFLEFLLFSLIS